jgi:hypothetical protein
MPESMPEAGPAKAGHYTDPGDAGHIGSAQAGHYTGPRIAAWVIGALTAVALAGSVYQVPIQVSDSLEVIERVIPMPSATAAFVDGLHNSPTMLRPLKEVRTRLLVQAGDALGGRYHLVFRGYHALAGVMLIALFVWVCRARSWTDVAALAVALAVLTGMHTFVGLFRESFPVNHYLIVAVSALATFALAQSLPVASDRPYASLRGWLTDLAAIVLLANAALSFESGLLVWPVAVAAYAAGLRGISRRGVVLMTVVVVLYAGLRVGYLGKHGAGVGERGTGFGAGALTEEEQIERFGNRPLVLYAYNVTTTAASVLLSQPQVGRFTVVSAWNNGSLPPVFIVQIASSLLTTALIGWYIFSRGPSGSRRWREPVPLTFFAVLAVSSLMSYAYAKDEIVSTAGVFYAVAAYVAVRAMLSLRPPVWAGALLIVIALAVSCAWALRSAGLHLRLRHGAFEARTGWAYVLWPTKRNEWPKDAHTLRVVSKMREEALMHPTVAPAMLPKWTELWWGED